MKLPMQTNKNIEQQIAEKLKNRELQPSSSAWERLANQLDEQEAKSSKRRWRYLGYAASILLLISAGVFYLTKDGEKFVNDNVTVEVPIDTSKFTTQPLKELMPVEEAVVQTEETPAIVEETIKEQSPQKLKTITKAVVAKHTTTPPQKKMKTIVPIKDKTATPMEAVVIAKVDATQKEVKTPQKNIQKLPKTLKKSNFRIKINSDDLLYAVTHTPQEVKAYYAKYNVKRGDVLKTIQQELKKTNLKVDPNTILAEVEKNIDEDDFKNNFMQRLKTKISDIAVAIAYRNK